MTKKQLIVIVDGKVTDGNLTPTLTRGIDVEVKPYNDDGEEVFEANVTLVCGDPTRIYTGNELDDGTYVFKDAVPHTGQEECILIVEAPG